MSKAVTGVIGLGAMGFQMARHMAAKGFEVYGFDVQEARRKGGLGLLSMQERIHLVHGRLNVESAPGLGTRVVATVSGSVDERPLGEDMVYGDGLISK